MIMKPKNFMYGISILAAIGFISGCGNAEEQAQSKAIANQFTNESANIETIEFRESITEIENGFSYAEYKSDYGFETFLRQGGAEADADVFRFLAGNLFAEAEALSLAEEAFGCSTVSAQSADGEWIFGRNFDWNRCEALVVKSMPQEGYASIATVNMDFIKQGAGLASAFLSDDQMLLASLYAPLDGMNEKGFCISVNMISDGEAIQQNSDKPDLTTTTAVRFLLNQAGSVEEAIDLLKEYDMHSSMGMMVHFAMADSTGRSVVVEYIDSEMKVTETPVVTNFYLTEGEKYGVGTEQSHERYEILMNTIAEQTLSMGAVADALDSVSKDNFVDSSTTEWSAVFNQSTKDVIYYHRENYKSGYQFSLSDS